MKQKSLGPPIGIILTMPVKFFEETGHNSETLGEQLEAYLNDPREDDNGLWYFMKKSLPTQDFLYVYLLWDGKIQYRTNLVLKERNKTYSFYDYYQKEGDQGEPRTFYNKNWIIIGGPAVKAPTEIQMKGFQGFRYVNKELW